MKGASVTTLPDECRRLTLCEVARRPMGVALHFMYYNFARPHKSLANPYPRTPAMAAGVTDHIWTVEEIASLTLYPH